MATLVLKIRFPAFESKSQLHVQALRTFKFGATTTVEEALAKVVERSGLAPADPSQYGFYVPSYSVKGNVMGWLPLDSTLASLGLRSGAELDFRVRNGRMRTVWPGKLSTPVEVKWNDEVPIKRNLVALCRDFAQRRMLEVMPPTVNRKVAILNKNEMLLNYAIPETAEFVLSAQEGWKYSADCTDEELLENCYFFVQTPCAEGEVYKKVTTGFRRGWKKIWCVLQKDTLAFYPDHTSTAPIGGVHLRNMEFCYQSEPIDAQSKKLGAVFKLGTTGNEKVIYLGLAKKDMLPRWINSISHWMAFNEFFRPKAISERGVALSHILSGQIRPNPKTYGDSAAGADLHVPDAESAARRSSTRASVMEDTLPPSEPLEVQPNREISVELKDGTVRDMVVDSRLDVYELAYMIAEEIGSDKAFIISGDDFGAHRQVELLDHQSSLASQQIPLSARFSIRKTGIVDDFVRECDIYDNHFLFVTLPVMEGWVLCQNEEGEWRQVHLILYAGKMCALDDDNDVTHVLPMRQILSIFRSESVEEDPLLREAAFTMYLTGDREMYFLASSPDACDDWCDLDGWCGFRCNSMLMDPTEGFSWKLYDGGKDLEGSVAQFLNLPEPGSTLTLSPRSGDLVSPLTSPRSEGGESASPLRPLSVSPLSVSPRDDDDDGEESVLMMGRPSGGSEDSPLSSSEKSPQPASVDGLKELQHAIPANTPLKTSSGAGRIKQFDWRRGRKDSDPAAMVDKRASGGGASSPADGAVRNTSGGMGKAGARQNRRKSVEELFLPAESDEEDECAEEVASGSSTRPPAPEEDEDSAALRVPSDDDEASFDTRTEKGSSSICDDDSTVDPVVLTPGARVSPPTAAPKLNSRPSSGRIVKEVQLSSSTDEVPADYGHRNPQKDVSRMIRRAYESIEPVKLKALPDDDPSLYCWKVLHSINLQKLGYASARSAEVVFYDLRGHEVLRVLNSELPGLAIPSGRLQRVEATLKQMRKSSKRDLRAELMEMYGTDSDLLLRKARNAEFEYRVVFRDSGEQLGWASRRGLDMRFFDMNGKVLRSVPSDMVGPAVLAEGSGAPQRILPGEVRKLFGCKEQVRVERAEVPGAYEFQVVADDGTHIGYGAREAFDFAFLDLDGELLGRIPLVAVPPSLASLIGASASTLQSANKKRSSSGVGRGSRKGSRLKDSSSAGPTPLRVSSSSLLLAKGKNQAGSDPAKEQLPSSPLKSARRLSEWQLKLRNSGPFKSPEGGGAGGTGTGKLSASKSQTQLPSGQKPTTRARGDSVDYTPDGLSPGLEDSVKEYDPEGKHRPMGLAGLLGEPDDASE